MSNQLAIEVLEKKRQELLLEKEAFLSRINSEINAIEGTIEQYRDIFNEIKSLRTRYLV